MFEPHVFLIDASSFIYRGYFASLRDDPQFQVTSDGRPMGAIRKFTERLFNFYCDGATRLNGPPITASHLVVCFDKSRGGWRSELYPAYKANRSETPDDLKIQLPAMREAVRAFGLPTIEIDGYEADDLIASYARAARGNGYQVLICSADKDLMQLLRAGVRMYDPQSGSPDTAGYRPARLFDYADVCEVWGVDNPRQIIDVQALAGDATDNIPGAPGIGVKTAAALVKQYGSLENVFENANMIPQKKRREILTDESVKQQVIICKELVTLDQRVPLPVPLHETEKTAWPGSEVVEFMQRWEMTGLARRAAEYFGVQA